MNTDNVYVITATVSDGSLTDSEDFNVTVTNDTSDDITSVSFDGTLVAMGPIQGATVCIEVTAGTCSDAQLSTTSAQDGTFSITFFPLSLVFLTLSMVCDVTSTYSS